jgi:hypothetical protein
VIKQPFKARTTEELMALLGAVATAILACIIVATMYFGREIFVPIALAILLSFALAPLVGLLQHLRVPRGVAVWLPRVWARLSNFVSRLRERTARSLRSRMRLSLLRRWFGPAEDYGRPASSDGGDRCRRSPQPDDATASIRVPAQAP